MRAGLTVRPNEHYDAAIEASIADETLLSVFIARVLCSHHGVIEHAFAQRQINFVFAQILGTLTFIVSNHL